MAATTYYYHFDAAGSTERLTDASQATTDTYDYPDAFGGLGGSDKGSVTPNRYRWLGQIGYSSEGTYVDFQVVRRRVYRYDIGRWLSQDPLGFAGDDANLYGYVTNNPINAIDPSGLAPDFKGTRASACAGTDCDEKDGIKTWQNPNADPSCTHPCKALIVDAHEATHRANMKECCARRNKGILLLKEIDLSPDEARRAMDQVSRLWNLYKTVNRDNLERLAAVNSCSTAVGLAVAYCCSFANSFSAVVGCCQVADKEAGLLCKIADPNAKLTCCPFQKDGIADPDCIRKLVDAFDKMPKKQ